MTNALVHPPIDVILNGQSGSGAAGSSRSRLEGVFQAQGLSARIHHLDTDRIAELLAEEGRAKDTLVVAAGGDGTISSVAAKLADTGCILGVIPLGTLNHFSKDLGIPPALEEAVAVLAHGKDVEVDVGEVNGRVFINNSSLGLYPRIVLSRDRQQKLGRGKWPALFWAFLQALHRYPFLDLEITLDGKSIQRRTAFLFVGNNHYELAGLNLGGRARVDAGHLGLYVTRRTGRLGLFRLLFHALRGRLEQAEDFDAFRVTDAIVKTRRGEISVATDGEVTRMTTPLSFRIRPRALRVRVPR